jgi:hypothetical protein
MIVKFRDAVTMVDSIFFEIFGAQPDVASLQYWVSLLQKGHSIEAIRRGIVQGVEAHHSIREVHKQCRGRLPSGIELQAGVLHLLCGKSIKNLEEHLKVESTEIVTGHSLSRAA